MVLRRPHLCLLVAFLGSCSPLGTTVGSVGDLRLRLVELASRLRQTLASIENLEARRPLCERMGLNGKLDELLKETEGSSDAVADCRSALTAHWGYFLERLGAEGRHYVVEPTLPGGVGGLAEPTLHGSIRFSAEAISGARDTVELCHLLMHEESHTVVGNDEQRADRLGATLCALALSAGFSTGDPIRLRLLEPSALRTVGAASSRDTLTSVVFFDVTGDGASEISVVRSKGEVEVFQGAMRSLLRWPDFAPSALCWRRDQRLVKAVLRNEKGAAGVKIRDYPSGELLETSNDEALCPLPVATPTRGRVTNPDPTDLANRFLVWSLESHTVFVRDNAGVVRAQLPVAAGFDQIAAFASGRSAYDTIAIWQSPRGGGSK